MLVPTEKTIPQPTKANHVSVPVRGSQEADVGVAVRPDQAHDDNLALFPLEAIVVLQEQDAGQRRSGEYVSEGTREAIT